MVLPFKKSWIAQSFNRATSSYDQAAVLQQEVCRRLLSQIEPLQYVPVSILDIGSGTGQATRILSERYPTACIYSCDIAENMVRQVQQSGVQASPVCGDAERLPFADQSIDLIFSSLMLQWCSDIDSVFKECYRVLKPKGVLFFSTLGLDTLYELHSSWLDASPDTALPAFFDLHTLGDALHAHRFLRVVMSQETLRVYYKSVPELLRDLRGIGANRLAVKENDAMQSLLGKQRFNACIQAYEKYRTQEGLLPASYTVVYGHTLKP